MNTKLTLGLAAIAASASLIVPSMASASAAHAGSAALSVVAAEVSNRAADAGSATGDITCTVQSDGGAVTPETNFFVGKIFAQDLGAGQAKCVSFTNNTYTMRLITKIQWFDGVNWFDTGCSKETRGTVTNGVGVVPVGEVTCNFGDASPYLDKYHRSFSTLIQTVSTKQFTDGSAMWFQRRG